MTMRPHAVETAPVIAPTRRTSGRVAIVATAIATTIAGGAAAAPAHADDDATAATLSDKKKEKKKAKAAAKQKKGDTIEVHGRVFARASAATEETPVGTTPWTGALSLASARIGVDYQWREQVRVKASLDAGKLRDAFVEIPLGHGLRVRAGRMKLPIGALEQTSAWTLPTIDRGLVADVLADGLGMTGRRSSIELRWRGAGAGRPTVTVTAAQGVRTAGGEQAGVIADGGGVTVAARLELTPCPMYRVAVVGASRALNYGSGPRRYWSATVEAEVDLTEIDAGLRLWGDASYGSNHLGVNLVSDDDRPFVAAELTAGYRIGGADTGARYVEPYLSAGYMNPIADHKRDEVVDVMVGVAGGLWKRWRAQAQFTYDNAKALRPPGLLGLIDVNDRMEVAVQLGAAF